MSPIVTSVARTTTVEDVPDVARVLSRALHDDPLFRWLFPDDELRMAKVRRFFALAVGFGYTPSGDVRVAELAESTESAPVTRAAALWAPPNSNPEGPLVSLRTWPHWGALIGRARLAAFVRIFAEWKMASPQEQHLYLAALGVDPSVAGTGVAGGLLTAGLDEADSQGLPVFTQTLNDKSVGFYERFGFRCVHEVPHEGIGTSYFLLRPAS
ncbi:MAG: GNAT family N-acetyltransferase [Nocardiopsis sp. BM-2018]|uniref:GNAT superfamily N-acetyltransferase n=1 Tax=Nocardiopsis metallicus TaxID=179819 RepID=A0A840WRV3_9ACTN|nr:GNAT family N-acetyltransferase [Nocardiopsis metallicus]MBB5492858.1 GNAT superfamily N-acetyltransferase [Nocardiopsis metallicus]QRN80751.1 MAG: GNAT family N-acetyltransferase [Nocardiopsis sp. BM-2018]